MKKALILTSVFLILVSTACSKSKATSVNEISTESSTLIVEKPKAIVDDEIQELQRQARVALFNQLEDYYKNIGETFCHENNITQSFLPYDQYEDSLEEFPYDQESTLGFFGTPEGRFFYYIKLTGNSTPLFPDFCPVKIGDSLDKVYELYGPADTSQTDRPNSFFGSNNLISYGDADTDNMVDTIIIGAFGW